MSRSDKLKVLVVDDHIYFRKSLAEFLSEMPFIEVAGEAGDGIEAADMALKLLPDMVVMDVRMPGQNGIDAARKIKEHDPSIMVILYSMYDAGGYDPEGLKAADRFIPKQRLFEEISKTLKDFYLSKGKRSL